MYIINTWWKGVMKRQPGSLNSANWQKKRWWRQTKKKTHKNITFHLNTSKQGFFYSDSGKTWAWRGCEASLCGDAQNLTGEGPGQAAPAELLDQMILRGLFRFKGFFCDRREGLWGEGISFTRPCRKAGKQLLWAT